MTSEKPVIAVISSHVARGAVGNRVMVPVLEELGFDVWAVPTIVLPFHPGQGRGERIVPPDEAFDGLLDDLASRDDLNRVRCVISGYLGAPAQAKSIARFVDRIRGASAARYVCDPVMGDRQGLYVPEETACAIRDRLVPVATAITPNRYEHDWLTGETGSTPGDWLASAKSLAPPTQIITSVPAGNDGQIGNMLVARNGDGAPVAALKAHEALAAVPSGTGDLLTAAFAGLWSQPDQDITDALARATAKVHRSVRASVSAKSADLLISPGFEIDDTVVSLQPGVSKTEWSHA